MHPDASPCQPLAPPGLRAWGDRDLSHGSPSREDRGGDEKGTEDSKYVPCQKEAGTMRDTEAERGEPGPLGGGHVRHLKGSGVSVLATWVKGIPGRGTVVGTVSRSERRVGTICDVSSQDKGVTHLSHMHSDV